MARFEYRWGHYYDRRGRLYAEQLQDYLGVSLYGSDYPERPEANTRVASFLPSAVLLW